MPRDVDHPPPADDPAPVERPAPGGRGVTSASTALEALRATPLTDLTQLPGEVADALASLRTDFERFDLEYRSALLQVETRLETLQDEFTHLHEYNPIEHIATRVKSPESLLRKAASRGLSLDLDALRSGVTDIAGARVIVSFTEDVYRVFRQFTSQPDIRVLEVEDYIRDPKPSGYRSLHCLVQVPVHLTTGTVPVTVELQFRTIAMDFWASLEHKINYKFAGHVPPAITTELAAAARVAHDLDARMERLHQAVHDAGAGPDEHDDEDDWVGHA
ncbi:GTP pyrophosphokinase family protein [Micrococcus porci]|uniref:GTP pyrophosphokinase n=1 Tax=Micrococcus porci TaxID=2856555 RepID=UPI001CCA1C41|nr:GTP pyrophosphokinase family protein [Micrococcus porci]UBH25073.1 GTP pyrophosphokinase family protein [Micrococcus porci]